MRIAFAGASGTGKTMLAREVAQRLGLPFCPVGSRSVAKAMGLADGYEADRAGKGVEFRRRLLRDKVSWEQAHEIFVTDRTHVDNAVYSMLQGTWDNKSTRVQQYANANTRYTHVFLCLMGTFWDLGADPSREPSREYHERFEAQLLVEMARMIRTVPITIVTPADLEERVAFVERVLGVRRCACKRRMATCAMCVVCDQAR